MSPVEREHIIRAYTFELGKCYEQAIKERQLQCLANIDPVLCEQVATGLGLPVPEPAVPLAEVEPSPALSQLGREWPADGRLIGSCQLHGIHPVHRSAELQIRIGEAGERGRGHGTEAVTLLVDFAFRDLNLRRVALHVLATNERALKMYERIGFVREGVLREAAHVDGEYVDVRFSFKTKKMGNEAVTSNVANAFIAEIERQMGQDIPIWENKIMKSPPVLCDGDGPIGLFRRWSKQFYVADATPGDMDMNGAG